MNLAAKAAVAKSAMRHKMPDGTELAAFGSVDEVKLVVGDPRRRLVGHELTPEAARSLMWFLIRWWFGMCWAGARTRLLRRALARAVEQAGRPQGEVRGVK